MSNPKDLCLAADVSSDLNVAESAVARSITAASVAIASYLGYPLEQAEVTEHPVSGGSTVLFLSRAPVSSISEVSVYGSALDPADYQLDSTLGTIRRKAGSWPLTATIGGYISPIIESYESSPDVLSVTYTAGFVTPGQNALDPITYTSVTLPADIQEAAALTACAFYRLRGQDSSLASESLGDWSVSYRAPSDTSPISDTVKALLAPYRRVI